jgi:CheY-like chemotaxis protein
MSDAPSISHRSPLTPPSPRRVLCAEVDASRRLALFSALARPGVVVECVRDGLEAFEHFEKYGEPDLLVTAHDLPRLDGLALVSRLRRAGYSGRVIVTAAALPAAAAAAYGALNVAAILASPLPVDALIAAAELSAA